MHGRAPAFHGNNDKNLQKTPAESIEIDLIIIRIGDHFPANIVHVWVFLVVNVALIV